MYLLPIFTTTTFKIKQIYWKIHFQSKKITFISES